jgi:hypothetical protein
MTPTPPRIYQSFPIAYGLTYGYMQSSIYGRCCVAEFLLDFQNQVVGCHFKVA